MKNEENIEMQPKDNALPKTRDEYNLDNSYLKENKLTLFECLLHAGPSIIHVRKQKSAVLRVLSQVGRKMYSKITT